MINWQSLPDDWLSRYQALRLPWARFLPDIKLVQEYAVKGHRHDYVERDPRIELLPRSERAFLFHAMDATTTAWSENWHEIMFLDSGRGLPRSRRRSFVPVIATIPEVRVFPELERLADALGPVFLETGIFPSIFFVTDDLRAIVREAQNPWWLMTESLAFSWSANA